MKWVTLPNLNTPWWLVHRRLDFQSDCSVRWVTLQFDHTIMVSTLMTWPPSLTVKWSEWPDIAVSSHHCVECIDDLTSQFNCSVRWVTWHCSLITPLCWVHWWPDLPVLFSEVSDLTLQSHHTFVLSALMTWPPSLIVQWGKWPDFAVSTHNCVECIDALTSQSNCSVKKVTWLCSLNT